MPSAGVGAGGVRQGAIRKHLPDPGDHRAAVTGLEAWFQFQPALRNHLELVFIYIVTLKIRKTSELPPCNFTWLTDHL